MRTNQIFHLYGVIVRGAVRIPARIGTRIVGNSFGAVQRVRHFRQPSKPEMDDVTLARKVETEIFRGSGAPKSTVNVNVVDGVVWLRGEVKRAAQVRSLEQKARSVPEVRGVENLLHLSKTPAPTRADTPKRQQRTRSSTRRPTPRRGGGRITDDRTDAIVSRAEASPAEHAERGEGRSPAPFGATGGEEESKAQGDAPGTSADVPGTAADVVRAPSDEPSAVENGGENPERPVPSGENPERPVSSGESPERPVSSGESPERPVSSGENPERPVSSGEDPERRVSSGERRS